MRSRMIGLVPFLALVATTAIWGSTFPLTKWQLDSVDASSFLAIRFTLTAVLMFALFWRRIFALRKWQWRGAAFTGCIYGIAQLIQTWGLKFTSASISGFVTGVTVIITPFLVWAVYRRQPRAIVTASATVAFVGLGIITINGQSSDGTAWGAALSLISAFLYAGHVVAVGHFSTEMDTWAFVSVQMAVAAVLASLGTIPLELTLPPNWISWSVMLYMVIFASMIAVVGQAWSQRHIDAGRSAIIMALEPVFASAFAIAAGQDHLTWNIALGGTLIVCATVLAEGTKLFQPARLRQMMRYRGKRVPE